MFSIEMLSARQGDALWIEYGDPSAPHRILIDGGPVATYTEISRRIRELPAGRRHFELFVLTHVDADHVEGAVRLLARTQLGTTFGDIWFNGWQQLAPDDPTLGPPQGEFAFASIAEQGLRWNRAFDGKAVVVPDSGPLPRITLPGGMRLTLLSPTPTELARLRPVWRRAVCAEGFEPGNAAAAKHALHETRKGLRLLGETIPVRALAGAPFSPDTSETNGSTIALIAEYAGARCLLAGDGFAGVLASSIRRWIAEEGGTALQLAAFKLPHHGSKYNVSAELLSLLACERFLISTNGHHHKHPDGEAIARVITHGASRTHLCFNYRTKYTSVWDDAALKREFRYDTTYPTDGQSGLAVHVA